MFSDVLPIKKILPLSDEAPITYDLRLAIPLMAAFSDDSIKDDVWNWILTNYTQLVCKNKINNNIPYNFLHVYDPYKPFIKRKFERHYRYFWKNPEKTLNYIIKKISLGHYVHLKMDRYFLKGFEGYNVRHIMHTECIYGYDLNRKELYVIGYLNLSKASLKTIVISFDDFLIAFESFLHQKLSHTITFDKINSEFKYQINYKKMAIGLKNYIDSKMSFEYIFESNIKKYSVFSWDFPIKCSFGCSSINNISNMLLLNVNYNRQSKIKIILQAVLEFHRIMLKRIDYFYNQGIIDVNIKREYEAIVTQYETIKFLYLKYMVRKDSNLIQRIAEQLNATNKKSKDLLNFVLTKIDNCDESCGVIFNNVHNGISKKVFVVFKLFVLTIFIIMRELYINIKEIIFQKNLFK